MIRFISHKNREKADFSLKFDLVDPDLPETTEFKKSDDIPDPSAAIFNDILNNCLPNIIHPTSSIHTYLFDDQLAQEYIFRTYKPYPLYFLPCADQTVCFVIPTKNSIQIPNTEITDIISALLNGFLQQQSQIYCPLCLRLPQNPLYDLNSFRLHQTSHNLESYFNMPTLYPIDITRRFFQFLIIQNLSSAVTLPCIKTQQVHNSSTALYNAIRLTTCKLSNYLISSSKVLDDDFSEDDFE